MMKKCNSYNEPLRKEYSYYKDKMVQKNLASLCINCQSWLTSCAAITFPYIPAMYTVLVTTVGKSLPYKN